MSMGKKQIKALKKELIVMLQEQETWSVHVPMDYRIKHTTIIKMMLIKLSKCSVTALS